MLKNLRSVFLAMMWQSISRLLILKASVGSEATGSGTMSQGDEGSPMVKEALRIFGGSIKTVRRENG